MEMDSGPAEAFKGKVARVIGDFEWKIPYDQSNMMHGIMEKAKEIPLPRYDCEDMCVWSPNLDGNFIVQSAWDKLRRKKATVAWGALVWCKKLQPRLSIFGWRLMHEKLPTDWDVMRKGQDSLQSFMKWWMRKIKLIALKEVWIISFIIAEHIWKERNGRRFEDRQRQSRYVLDMIKEDIRESILEVKNVVGSVANFLSCRRLGFNIINTGIKHPLEVFRCKPPTGWVKFNFDGSSLMNPDCAGAGGIMRDHNGRCLWSFSMYLGVKEIYEAEVEGSTLIPNSNNVLLLNGSNFNDWHEELIYYLATMDHGYALRNEKLAALTDESTDDEVTLHN
ncbi:uncharacterized protein LOC122067568 [Macadamia integrifolia]|uniref:uncharacterized protein LOC122067568 n=1 Tax=Macadamia integrifolia TaxID=60698 RepID=UPI001C4FD42E|nr:uncharacterized protein LOC122067568 [Macadamia integrifolia]